MAESAKRLPHLGPAPHKSEMQYTKVGKETTQQVVEAHHQGVEITRTWFHIVRNVVNAGIAAHKKIFGIDTGGANLHFKPKAFLIDSTTASDEEIEFLSDYCERIDVPFIVTDLKERPDKHGDPISATTFQKDSFEARKAVQNHDKAYRVFLDEVSVFMLVGPKGDEMSDEEWEKKFGPLNAKAARRAAMVYDVMKWATSQEFKDLRSQYTQTEWVGHISVSDNTPPLPECDEKIRAFFVEKCGYDFIAMPPRGGERTTLNNWQNDLFEGPDCRHHARMNALRESRDERTERVQTYTGDTNTQAQVNAIGGRRVEVEEIDTPHLTTRGDE